MAAAQETANRAGSGSVHGSFVDVELEPRTPSPLDLRSQRYLLHIRGHRGVHPEALVGWRTPHIGQSGATRNREFADLVKSHSVDKALRSLDYWLLGKQASSSYRPRPSCRPTAKTQSICRGDPSGSQKVIGSSAAQSGAGLPQSLASAA